MAEVSTVVVPETEADMEGRAVIICLNTFSHHEGRDTTFSIDILEYAVDGLSSVGEVVIGTEDGTDVECGISGTVSNLSPSPFIVDDPDPEFEWSACAIGTVRACWGSSLPCTLGSS